MTSSAASKQYAFFALTRALGPLERLLGSQFVWCPRRDLGSVFDCVVEALQPRERVVFDDGFGGSDLSHLSPGKTQRTLHESLQFAIVDCLSFPSCVGVVVRFVGVLDEVANFTRMLSVKYLPRRAGPLPTLV